MSEVTRILSAIEQGDPHAAELLLLLRVIDSVPTAGVAFRSIVPAEANVAEHEVRLLKIVALAQRTMAPFLPASSNPSAISRKLLAESSLFSLRQANSLP